MNKEINIITLGDVFDNLETDVKAYKFVSYIKKLQQENQQLKDKVFNKSATINKVKQFCENKMVKMKKSRNSIAVFLLIDILKIIENSDSND